MVIIKPTFFTRLLENYDGQFLPLSLIYALVDTTCMIDIAPSNPIEYELKEKH